MQTNAPFFDDVSKLMSGAMGLAQAASEEARSAFRAQGDRLAAELDLVRRDEMDAALDVLRAESRPSAPNSPPCAGRPRRRKPAPNSPAARPGMAKRREPVRLTIAKRFSAGRRRRCVA
jgi:hypothetical protein